MSILDDIKAKADANGDGKVTLQDLDAMRDGTNDPIIDELKAKALRYNGKLDMSNPTHINAEKLINDPKLTQ